MLMVEEYPRVRLYIDKANAGLDTELLTSFIIFLGSNNNLLLHNKILHKLYVEA